MPLARAFFRVHWDTYRNWLLVKLLNDFNQTLPAILLNLIMEYLNSEEGSFFDGAKLVIGCFLLMMLKTFVSASSLCVFFRNLKEAAHRQNRTSGSG